MASYVYAKRLVIVEDGKVTRVDDRWSGYSGLKKLPAKYRAEARAILGDVRRAD